MKKVLLFSLFVLTLLAFVTLSLLDLRAQTPVQFIDSGQSLGSAPGYDVALSDLDGDGDRDAFVANFGFAGNSNAVWLNDGTGNYTDSGQALGSGDSYQVALGDLDGDNDLDAFIGNSGPNTVWWNNGSGSFSDSGQSLGSYDSWGVALGDVDGDNDLDAVTANVTEGQPDKIWINQGGAQGGTPGTFADGGQLGATGSGAVALADLDGDNDLDVFLGISTSFPRADQIWLNDGSGTFSDSGQALGGGMTAGVTLGDVDGDGDLDAVATNTDTTRQHTVWINQGGAQGSTPGTFAGNGQTNLAGATLDVELGDLDGDGDLDAFVPVYFNGGPNRVWLNDGGAQGGTPGQFTDVNLTLGNSSSYGAALGDVDGDQDLDVFTANYGNGVVGEPNKVWLNQAVPPTPTDTPTPTPEPSATPLPPGAEGWQQQIVDMRGNTGRQAAMVLDSNGRPHVVYVRLDGFVNAYRPYLILYTYWDGIRWQEQTVTRARRLSSDAILSLALDSQDLPHVSYQIADQIFDVRLWYAHWDGTQWHRHDIDEGDSFAPHTSIVLDKDDNPHISYVGDPGLKYAYWDGEAWQIEDVDNQDGGYNSLALDSSGFAHVTYRNNSDFLKYAYRDTTGWHTEMIDDSLEGRGPGTSLALDNLNRPHIAYLGDGSLIPNNLQYAYWDGSEWQTELLAVGSDELASTVSLVLDADQNPHLVYAEYEFFSGRPDNLYYRYWDGAAWQVEVLADREPGSRYPSLALDDAGTPHVTYYDRRYQDLIYVTWAPYWQTREVGSAGAALFPALDNEGYTPYVSFYGVGDGRLQAANWQDGAWQTNPVAFLPNPPVESSLYRGGSTTSISYYDPDNQRLMLSQWDGTAWQTQVVDAYNDVGRYNDLFGVDVANLGTHITYWDATTYRVKFASIDNGSVTLHTNVAGPPLNAASGYLSGGWLPGGDVIISYYDGIRGDLRVAIWDKQAGSWSDELVDGAAADVGRFSSLQVDTYTNQPVVAYYDATNGRIKVAYRDALGWQVGVAVAAAGEVQSLELALTYGSGENGRISFIDQAGDTLYVAIRQEGQWHLEAVVNEPGLADVSASANARLHMAYSQAGNLEYAFRTVRPGVRSGETLVPPPDYNPLYACASTILGLIFPGDERARVQGIGAGETAVAGAAPLSDPAIFNGMTSIFAASEEGERYIELYLAHGAEMGQIGLSDPQLLRDSYGTLQNFMPGLEALVLGNGAAVTVTQQMVDDALDVWTRIAAKASPELAGVINEELERSNNLQDFVGLTFAEWAEAIGVEPPRRGAYLPLLRRD